MGGDMGKSVPVLKDFWVETALAPITPGKPANPNGQTLSNRGQIAMVSNEVASSSHSFGGLTGKTDQAEGWAPVHKLQTLFLGSNSTQPERVFASRNSISEEIDSLAHWGTAKFSDILALNRGFVIPIGGNQASNRGLLNSLHETAEELQGLNGRVEIQQNAEKRRPAITMNLFPQEHIPVFAPATPGYYKSFQGNGALPDKTSQDTPNKPNEEYGEASDTDDLYKEEEDPNDLDLNKTSQQKPRRKKHRPKVVSEVKPKQRTQKSAGANKTPRQQRKYVSKSKTNISLAIPPPEREEIALDCKIPDQRPFRSCRKTLKFDLEDQMEATREYSTYDILHEFNTAMEYGEGRKTKNLTAISSKHETYLKRSNSGSADSEANHLYLRGKIFSCVHKKRRTEKVVKTNTAHILSFTNALESIRATTLKKCSREDRGIYFPEICKRRRTEKVLKVNTSHILSFTRALENIRKAKGLQNNGKQAIKWGDINELYKRFISSICVHDLDSEDGFRAYKRPSRSSVKGRVKGTQKKIMITLQASSIKSHHRKQNRNVSRKKKSVAMENKQSLILYDDQHFTENPKGRFLALPWINTSTTNVGAIIEGMKQLSINREGSIVQYQQINALIPYHVRRRRTNNLALYRGNSAIIPFEGEQSRKKHERAKVDLDDETNRVWNLLLEDINNQGIDGTDEDKTKWWEEERNVFRGRVNSFIARMRLVQGDRRFSPWKGSVVDSVVGVFLTQNVSDHLSSSAYMSLAARYPLNPENEARRDFEEEIGTSVKEADICIVELDDTSDKYELNKPVEGYIFNRNFRTSDDTDVGEVVINTDLKDNTLCLSLGNPLYRASSIKELDISSSVDNITIDDVMSSQNSVSSLNSVEYSSVPTPGICVHSNNHLEGEDVTHNTSFQELLQLAEKTVLHATSSPIEEVPFCQSDQEDIIAGGEEMVFQSQRQTIMEQQDAMNFLTEGSISPEVNLELPTVFAGELNATDSTCASISTTQNNLAPTLPLPDYNYSGEVDKVLKQDALVQKTKKQKKPKKASYEWDNLRKQAQANGSRQRTANTMDSIDWEAIRCADVKEISSTIRDRGMNNMLAERIKEFLDRLVNDHGSIDLEWIRDVPPDKAKEYLLSIKGLGLKSVECVRLLTLHHLAFPVDTNVGRIAVRLGWVPLQPLPESLQLHLLELYPILESIQKYLWPRLCKLNQRTLYELHYHMITFGKVFCTKRQPNCNACPLRGECRHFASAFASARLALPGPQDKSMILSNQSNLKYQHPQVTINGLPMPHPMANLTLEATTEARNCEPIVEIPASPEQESEQIHTLDCDIEDAFSEDPNEIPTIKLNMEEFTQTLKSYINSNQELQEGDMSKALVALAAEAASIPTPKLKNVSSLRTEHHVYELPETHYLLNGLDKREPDDPCPYLLAIWSPGETANSTEPPEKRCSFEEPGQLCSDVTCFYCNSQREANSQIVRGTLLIPCRTAMRGRFPLNGTYFQVNEVFADQDSSLDPIKVPRVSLWNLPRRTVYFGTSIPTIFKGLSTEGIQHCFWRGYVCVRGFDQKTRAPRPLMARLHFPASKSRARRKFSEQD